MNNLSTRNYNGAADLQAMIDLTRSLRTRGQIVYPIAADLFEELGDPTVRESVCLWENCRSQLTGFAYVSSYQNLVNVFDADLFSLDIENEVVNWAVAAIRQRNKQNNQDNPLDASAYESDLERQLFLERHGFERQEESSIKMRRSLDLPIPEPRLPPGFQIRSLHGEAELEAYVALHQAAFGTENMTVEFRRTIMSAPDFIPDLDLVVVTPDGRLAAFCVCQIFPEDMQFAGGQKEGLTDPVGTHPAYQRLGLAKALMLTGMRLLKEHGMDFALLGTSSMNIAMQRAAESVGFQKISNTFWYRRPV